LQFFSLRSDEIIRDHKKTVVFSLSCGCSEFNRVMPTAAIIVAAGTSQRMGFDKLAASLRGIPVLARSIHAFSDAPSVDEIYVVCSEARFRELVTESFSKPIIRVDGGSSRQESVQQGLRALSPEITMVAVHDGARPLVRVGDIEQCIERARQYGASSLARKVTETLKRADAEGFARSSVDRALLWFMETPQCFRLNVLKRAYQHVRERNLQVTDEVSAVDAIGISTFLVESSGSNLKITIPVDLEFASFLIGENVWAD
jgi:2-C-methyl-D-erythritol 4-phosphate cytidylyltransferase